MAETSSKFSSSIGNLIESQIFHIFNNCWMRLSMMWRIMQIEEKHAIDWILPTSASKYGNRTCVGCEDLAAGRQSETVKYWVNNIEKKQDFKLVALSHLTPLLLFKSFWWEGSNDKVIYACYTFQVCSTQVLFALCNGFTTLHFHIFLIVKPLYLS